MFEWKATYSVHLPTIDREHRALFRTVADLHSAILENRSRDVMGPLLDGLVRYTTFHFAHEERIMESIDYPDLQAHKAEHAALVRRIEEFRAEHEAGRTEITIKVLLFLKGWLVAHIMISDAKYASLVTAQAVSVRVAGTSRRRPACTS
jgi:hemerythrin